MIYDFEPSLNHSNLIHEKKKKKKSKSPRAPFQRYLRETNSAEGSAP